MSISNLYVLYVYYVADWLFLYIGLQTDLSEQKELLATGRSMEPIIARLSGDKLVLTKDNTSVFFNHSGEIAKKSVSALSLLYITLQSVPSSPHLTRSPANNR